MKKKMTSIFLSLCMVLSMLPMVTPAAQAADIAVSTAGELISAVSSATAGDTIRLTGSFTLTSAVTITQNLTLDLDDYTITAHYLGNAFTVGDGGDLTVTDTGSGNGKIYSTSTSSAINLSDNGNLTVNGGTLQSTNSYAIENNGAGTVSITGGTVKNTGSGNAILNRSTGDLNITGGTVQAGNGCAIYKESTCKITISGAGTVVTSANTGIIGTIYIAGTSTSATLLEIQGGTVSNTASSGDRNVVYAPGGNKVVIASDAFISGNLYKLTDRPTANTVSAKKATTSASSVSFKLTNSPDYTSGTTWYVYDASTGGSLVSDVTGSNVWNTLTLSHATNLPAGDYYVAAYDRANGHGESSGRLQLTVTNPLDLTAASDEAEFDAALAAVSTGGTILLTGDITFVAERTISADVTIDLNGHTISSNENTFKVTDTATLTVTDTSAVKNGQVTTSGFFAIRLIDSSSLILNAGTIKNPTAGYCAIYSDSSGKITISGATALVTSKNFSGGTIELGSGSASGTVLEIQSGTVESTGAGTDKIAVYNRSSGKVLVAPGAIITGKLYPLTATPATATATVAKANATQASVAFTLSNSSVYSADTTWYVYDASTGTASTTGVTASRSGSTLTLTHASNVTAGDYYVSAYDRASGHDESSARLKLTVTDPAVAPTATTSDATGVTATGATLNGSVNANGFSAAVTFEYGTSTGYGSSVTATQSPATGTGDTAVSGSLTGLTPNTTYHFRVTAVNSGGTIHGSDITFITSAIAPTATSADATSVTSTGATLNGSVNANNATSVVTFDYGTSTSYDSSVTATQSPVTGTSATSVSGSLTGLTPNTTYHFRVKAVNAGGTTYGSDTTFITSAIAPTATTSDATSVTATGATLNGTVNANNATSVVTFNYGTSTSYGSSVTAAQSPVNGTSATSVSGSLTGLTPNTTYHFRVKAVNSGGTTNGADTTFTTSAVPAVSSVSVPANGTYAAGQNLDFTVNFSQNVTVAEGGGTPYLSLTIGSSSVHAAYQSGSNTTALVFRYTVQSGVSDSNGIDVGTISANGGTIRDGAGNDANLTLTSIGSTALVLVDGVAPTVTNVSASTANGTYKAGDTISITVTFSEAVDVTGSPKLELETGDTDRTINLMGGWGGSVLTFYYMVQPGDRAADLDYKATSSLSGGTIRDAAGNNAVLTLPTPGAAGSLGANKAIIIADAPGAPTSVTATAGNRQANVAFTAPSSNGGSAIISYTVTSSPGGFTGAGTGSPITVTGLTNGTAYTFTVTATNGAGTSTASAASNSVTPKSTQTISFANPGTQNFGTTPTLSATADSGLNVYFTSDATDVCTITTEGVLTFLKPGTAAISAHQSGNSAWAPAPDVMRFFTVNAVVPGAPTNVTATAGNGQANVAFTAPSSNGGSAIISYTVTSSPGGFTGAGTGSPITVTGLTNGTAYTFKVTATNSAGTGAASASSNSVTPHLLQEATPSATFTAKGADTGTLSNVTSGMKYSVNGGVDWTTINGTSVDITNVTVATGVQVYHPGDNITTTDSTVQTITVTQATTPTTASKTNCTTIANKDGKLTGVTTAMEYMLSTASDWTSGTGSDITGLANGTYYVRVKATDTVLASDNQSLTITAFVDTQVIMPATNSTKPSNVASVIVGGETQTAGTSASSTNADGRTVTTITLDIDKLNKIIDNAGSGVTVTLPITGGSSVAAGILTGEIVKSMETKASTLEIETDSATYTLPASEINIDSVSKQFGHSVSLSDIKVKIQIAEPSSAMVSVANAAASTGGFTLVVPAVEYTISCSYGSQTVDVSSFNAFVERTIAIPVSVDPAKITTAVVVDARGTVRHVPTKIKVINGKSYAVINSLTNSTYTVVYNPVEFSDTANHWAKSSINDMGSRMIISGVGKNNFEPDRDITRAEFAAIVVRALGLTPGVGDKTFSDVTAADWYCPYIKTAVSSGLITGFLDGSFAPNDKITREQAMSIIARAMKITKLDATLSSSQLDALLSGYTDASNAHDYAVSSIASCLQTGIVNGRTATTLCPTGNITRAEVAIITQRLLQKSELI